MSQAGGTYGIRELANWILDYAHQLRVPITNMALNKLIFFAYEHALLLHGRKLTSAKIEAWEHGPVFREVYRSFQKHGPSPINSRAEKFDAQTDSLKLAVPNIDEADEVIIREAITPLIRLSASVLRELSHATGGAWDQVWHHTTVTNPGMHISDDVIRSSASARRSLPQ